MLQERKGRFRYIRNLAYAELVAEMLTRVTGQACYVHTVRSSYHLIMREISEGVWVEN